MADDEHPVRCQANRKSLDGQGVTIKPETPRLGAVTHHQRRPLNVRHHTREWMHDGNVATR